MNRKQIFVAMAGSLALSAAAFAGPGFDRDDFDRGYGDGGTGFDFAEVVRADPIVRQVRVSVPRRECFDETRYVPVRSGPGPQGAAGGMILGGIIGAVVGHQFDGGRGDWRHGRGGGGNTGTLAGGIVGAAIGHDVAERNAARAGGFAGDEVRAVTAQRCEVHEEEHVEDRTEGFRVTYRYQGRTYTTRMPNDPGPRIRVRVSVSPVG